MFVVHGSVSTGEVYKTKHWMWILNKRDKYKMKVAKLSVCAYLI